METHVASRRGDDKMKGLVIDTARDNLLDDQIDTPRKSRRRCDAAKIRRNLNRSSPAGTPRGESTLGLHRESKNYNIRPSPRHHNGDVTLCKKGPEGARQQPPLTPTYCEASPLISPTLMPPKALNDNLRTDQHFNEPSLAAKDELSTNTTLPSQVRDGPDDEPDGLFDKENAKPVVADTSPIVRELPPLPSSASSTFHPSITSNKLRPSDPSDDVSTKKIPTQVSDVSEQETLDLCVEKDAQSTLFLTDSGHVEDAKLIPKIGVERNASASLTRTNTSMTGTSVDVDVLVEEFISDKNIDHEPEVNLHDFDSFGSSAHSILLSNSIKDAKRASERNLTAEGEFDLSLRQIQLNNSSLSFSSRGDTNAAGASQNESSVLNFDFSNSNTPFTATKEVPNIPSPPRPTNPLRKKPVESRKSTVIPAVRVRRFRLRPDFKNNAASRKEPQSATLEQERAVAVPGSSFECSESDRPPLPAKPNSQAEVKLTDHGPNPDQHDMQSQPELESEDTKKTVLPYDDARKSVQKVYSFYTPGARFDFGEVKPPPLITNDCPTVLSSTSDLKTKMPCLIHKIELPVADVRDQIVSVLKSSSYSKASSGLSSSGANTDPVRIPSIQSTGTDQTIGRNNIQPNTNCFHENEAEPSSPIRRTVMLPYEDIEVSESGSDDEDLALDSIRLFERQVEAQMKLKADSTYSKPSHIESSDLESDTDASTDSSTDSDTESNSDSDAGILVTKGDVDLVCLPSKDVDLAQNSSCMTANRGETLLVAHNTSNELGPCQKEELIMLRRAIVELDAALERQRVVVKMQRREIKHLKKERDLLHADLKSSRLSSRFSWNDEPLVSRCVGKMGSWSNKFNSALKCE